MSLGLDGLLKVDYSSDFTLFSVDAEISALKLNLCRALLSKSEENNYKGDGSEEGSKYIFQIANFVNDFDPTVICTENSYRCILHDFVKQRFPGLEEFYEILLSNLNAANKNIILIDDLTLFSMYCSNETEKVHRFLRKMSIWSGVKVIGFVQKETLTFDKMAVFCDEADTVAILTGSAENQNQFVCNVIRSKSWGKTASEQGTYEIVKGVIKKVTSDSTKIQVGNANKDELLTNLTTFKLTLEENEKESKSQLYLPYFDAQKITTEDPFQSGLDDEDDDDEEI